MWGNISTSKSYFLVDSKGINLVKFNEMLKYQSLYANKAHIDLQIIFGVIFIFIGLICSAAVYTLSERSKRL